MGIIGFSSKVSLGSENAVGYLIRIACVDCGYSVEELGIGRGMYWNEDEGDLVVGTCEKCRILTTLREEQQSAECEGCSEMSVARTPAIRDESKRGWGPLEISYQCPACSGMNAISEKIGLWD